MTVQQTFDRWHAAAAALSATTEGTAEHGQAEVELFAADHAVLDAVATTPPDMALQLEFIAGDDANMLDDRVIAALLRIAARLRALDGAPAPTAAGLEGSE